VEDVAVEEEERAQRLVLGAGAHSPPDGEIREKRDDLLWAHVLGMALSVVEDESPHPGDVGLLGPQAVVTLARGDPNAVEELRWKVDGG
jgi:hypothetical protein